MVGVRAAAAKVVEAMAEEARVAVVRVAVVRAAATVAAATAAVARVAAVRAVAGRATVDRDTVSVIVYIVHGSHRAAATSQRATVAVPAVRTGCAFHVQDDVGPLEGL
eukprot:scaffold25088_cov72-Phaeocystis_antarctica.AAC.1